ncbi:MAG: hypothetical protein HRU03_08865, partial [Nanoarchaeales archaeon]|nr:hypothetical protein [Nanoarchaeales archaeon]
EFDIILKLSKQIIDISAELDINHIKYKELFKYVDFFKKSIKFTLFSIKDKIENHYESNGESITAINFKKEKETSEKWFSDTITQVARINNYMQQTWPRKW